MTGTLTVRYRSPTPLHTELRFEAELVRMEGRKIFTRAQVLGGDRVCAEAEGIFVSVARERFQELETLRAEREQQRSGERD
jgi:acyl-CoA thioesterase FadM